MDIRRKKELLEAYKNRRPEMGVISYKCMATGESFLGVSNDINADFNSTNMKLSSGYHPNKRLLELWKAYGKSGFEISVVELLEYDNPKENHFEELEKMRMKYLDNDAMARRIW